jgi:hypothetical protein
VGVLWSRASGGYRGIATMIPECLGSASCGPARVRITAQRLLLVRIFWVIEAGLCVSVGVRRCHTRGGRYQASRLRRRGYPGSIT